MAALTQKRRSITDLVKGGTMSKETSQQKDAYQPNAFSIKALYVRYIPPGKPEWPGKHEVIPFALDMLPRSETMEVDGQDTAIYEHVSNDRLVVRINVARLTEKGTSAVFVNAADTLTEGELCTIGSWKKIVAEPMDIVELGNVGLSGTKKNPTPSIMMDSSRTIPTAEHGITMADRAAAIYRTKTRFVPAIIPLAANRAIRLLLPRKNKEEGAPKTLYTRDCLGSFPLLFLSRPGIDPNDDGTLDPSLKNLPMYEGTGMRGQSLMQAGLPSIPEFISEGRKDKTGNPLPAEAQLYTDANVLQSRDADSGEGFHIRHARAYASNILGSPTLYPPEFDALMSAYPGFPMTVITTVDLRETLNSSINYGNEALRADSPDGELEVKFHAVVLNSERHLLERGIPCSRTTVQDRYGGSTVLTSVPFVQEDRAAAYAPNTKRAALKDGFTNVKEDKLLFLDGAALPLGDEKTTLFFALPLKSDIKGLDDIEDVSALSLADGDKLIRDNMKRVKDPKATGLEKLHGPWLHGDGKKQIPTFFFFSMDRAYAEKLRATGNKPLDMSSFFTPPTDRPVLAADAVDTVEECRFKHYTQLAVASFGTPTDEDDDGQKQGTKRTLEDVDPADEPDTKKQRLSTIGDDEKTRSGFEDEDAIMKDADGQDFDA